MPKNKKKEEVPYLSEPEVKYGGNLSISSFEQLSEQDRWHTRNMTHLQRMEYLQLLNYNLYSSDFTKQEEVLKKGKLTIRKPE